MALQIRPNCEYCDKDFAAHTRRIKDIRPEDR